MREESKRADIVKQSSKEVFIILQFKATLKKVSKNGLELAFLLVRLGGRVSLHCENWSP